MEKQATSIATVLTLAGQAHGAVFRYANGDDPDWATFYADWLVNSSPLPEILGKPPIRGHLTAALIELDRDYTAEKPDESWEDYYARKIAARFGTSA